MGDPEPDESAGDLGTVLDRVGPVRGRVVRVVITDAGRALIDTRRAERTGRLTALLEQLTAEQRATLSAALPLAALTEANASTPVSA